MSSSLPLDSKPYQSQSLDHTKQQIRLISILPSSTHDDHIRCAIETFDLETVPPFTALSYVWGPPDPRHQIYVAGGILEVRKNLFDFLREFRKQEEKEPSDQYLWIDQICINQMYIPERNHQVGMMSEIYKGADSVIVWLDDTDRLTGGSTYYHLRDFKKTGKIAVLWLIHLDTYFDRLWIVQEFILAKRVRLLVKDLWIYERNIFAWMDKDAGEGVHSSCFYSLLCRRQRTVSLPSQLKGICDMLQSFFHLSCEDPRDKIYGLMGLIDEQERVVIDYTKSIHQVIMDVVLVTCARRRERRSWDLQEQGKQFMLFHEIVRSLPFTRPQRSSVTVLLFSIWQPRTLGRFYHLPCPITAMGFEPTDKVTSVDRWWFDFQDTRYHVECTDPKLINAATKRLLHEDWEKYLPKAVPTRL